MNVNILGEEKQNNPNIRGKKAIFFSSKDTRIFREYSFSFRSHNVSKVSCCLSSDSISLGVYPIISYYLIDALHVNLDFFLVYHYITQNNASNQNHSFRLFPSIGIGYTFPIFDRLFFDIKGKIGQIISLYQRNFISNNTLGTSFEFIFKLDLSGSLINFGINYLIENNILQDSHKGLTSHQLRFIVGYSLYFHFD